MPQGLLEFQEDAPQLGNCVDCLERLSVALGCHPMELLYDKAMAKTEQEEAMLEMFHGLSAEQRDAFVKATTALAEPARLIDDSEEAG